MEEVLSSLWFSATILFLSIIGFMVPYIFLDWINRTIDPYVHWLECLVDFLDVIWKFLGIIWTILILVAVVVTIVRELTLL